jgi:hypothetical protein
MIPPAAGFSRTIPGMREWSLRTGDPLSLFLAADARFSAPDYTDDQIWELSLGGGDPPALAAETMLGLRAVSLRLFPVFFVDGRAVSNPSAFAAPPVVRRFAPNYLRVECRPVDGLDAVCEYWVPQSHALTGRITLTAAGDSRLRGECWLAGVLRPAAEGSPFGVESARPYGGAYLCGRAGNIAPVVVLGGSSGAGRSATPSLKAVFDAGPGRSPEFRWAHCGLASTEEGLALARSLIAREWEADIARVELENAALVDLSTGRPEWDAVLAFSQVTAIQSLIGPTRHLPFPSPVVGRNPERGYSLRGSGSDYPPGWSGASPWELLMILPVWSLAKAEAAKDILRNFLAAAGDDLPDSRPGPGKQRTNLLAPPLLAQLAWRVLSGNEDADFLHEMWPLVDRCLEAWFDPAHDRDRDGVPEWERMDSLGPQTPPLWDREGAHGGGVPPPEVESPSLAALLLGECYAAARTAEAVGQGEAARKWTQHADRVRRGIERMEFAAGYRTQDRETHRSPRGRLLWNGKAGAEGRPGPLEEPARLLIRTSGVATTRPVLRVVLSGTDSRGRPCEEELRTEHFSWIRACGSCFTRTVWKRVQSIRTEGPSEGTLFSLEVPDLRREDLSDFLPLWSRAAPAERAKSAFARLADPEGFDSSGGLRFLPAGDPAGSEEACADIWMLWNMLMGEAAIRYGRGDLALGWVEKAIRAAADMLRVDRAFRSSRRADRAGGFGPRNSLHGIFPVGLFLAGLGVFPSASDRVWIGGRSIFPFPVVLRYKGMIIRREGDRAEIDFPSGIRRSVEGIQRRLVREQADS